MFIGVKDFSIKYGKKSHQFPLLKTASDGKIITAEADALNATWN
jgi:hypothetical protein